METELEKILITSYKEQMISFMEDNPEAFVEAIELAMGSHQPYSWRAAWLLWSCMEDNDKQVKKYINKIMKSIPGKGDGHQRELIKIFSRMKLNDD